MKDKLWQKSYSLDERIAQFTIGKDPDFDTLLAPFDILGSLAHIQMLQEVGLLSEEDFKQNRAALIAQYQVAKSGHFSISPGVEDVHSQVELNLTQLVGDAGKKIHSGRSRNDQVLLDLRLYFRHKIEEIVQSTAALSEELLTLSEAHRDKYIPGYTHLQVAMVSSFGLWFGAYGESLIDDLRLWQSIYANVDQNPLGSAAGYGSSFPLDRQRTTALLGFSELAYNVVHAQMGRGKTELFLAFGISSLAQTIGKLATDVCLYSSQNFGFLQLPDELTTGSSIMPHKKNPDVFELVRGRCNLLMSTPGQISQLLGGQPSGYHRDFQLLKEVIFPALEQLEEVVAIVRYALPRMVVFGQDLQNDERYRYLYSVEVVNALVLEGTPFRDAYTQVGQAIATGNFVPPDRIAHTHLGSLGNLATEAIRQKLAAVLGGFSFEKANSALAGLVEP